ncbi:MAG: ATP-binding protein [Terracidiphilus sp.]|jgi:tetratricopeptide (TPR) repeat protein
MGELLQEEVNASGADADSLYPENGMPDALDIAAADHEAYAASRRTLYFGREEYAVQLASHIEGDGPPLVVTGDPGSGKSALLANFTHFWSQRNPETPILIHFIGAAPDTAGWMPMLRRLLGEFRRKFAIPTELPEDPAALRVAFANALHMVAAHGRLVLVLDALDKLEDRDGAPDLDWLPPVIPANVRLVVSTLPGRPFIDLQKRGWPVLAVKPLTAVERESLIVAYLARFEKTLSAKFVKRIASARPTGNALYLNTLLNELRSLGEGEELDQSDGFEHRLAWFLEAANPLALFVKAIERWEHESAQRGALGEDLAGECLTRLWAAHRGLSESELLESLGSRNAPFPRSLWTPLRAAMGDALVERRELLTFAHPLMRQAVRDAYLANPDDRHSIHLTLATFFYGQPKGPRQLEELPWQWQQAEEWKSLAFLLAQPGFFTALWNKDRLDVKNFWTAIEANSPLRMETIYTPAVRRLNIDPHHPGHIGDLFAAMGRQQAALRIFSGLVKHYQTENDPANLQAALGANAHILQSRDDLDGALKLYREQEQICRELLAPGNRSANSEDFTSDIRKGLQISLAGQAAILYSRGDLKGAMGLYKQQESLCRELGNNKGTSSALAGQASILYARGDFKGALTLLQDYERECREIGDKYGQATSLGSQAPIVREHGDLDGAMALLGSQERLYRELGHYAGVSNSLGNQAAILSARGDLNGAMARFKEQERICREVNHPEGLAISLANQAGILKSAKRTAEARLLADLALSIATRQGLKKIIPGIQHIRDSIAPAK